MQTSHFSGMGQPTDIELVELCRRGDREAYGRIVERYQNLVCAMAYSACGSVARSEDIAQDVFIAAWKQLRQLREPAKLKSWLCGIARNLIHNSIRREGRQATTEAMPLEHAAEQDAASPTPSEQVISDEEQALVWGALEQIPDNYREPLVLFYRENQSIQQVANALDLSEDAVKQRLSRGRTMLKAQVAALVEGTLANTRPGRAFTIGVIAALPALAPAAAAAAVAGGAAEGAAAVKSVSALSWAGAVLGPLIGLLGGYLGAKASIENTRTPRERAFMVRMSWVCGGFVFVFLALLGGTLLLARPLIRTSPALFAALLIGIVLVYAIGLVTLILWGNRRQRQIQIEDSTTTEPTDTMNGTNSTPPAGAQPACREYKSKIVLLGLPLVHIAHGAGVGNQYRRGVAKGWIAIGDVAFGILFAMGGLSVGGIAVGGLAVGVISLSGVAAGVFAFGGLAAGMFAAGGLAIGIWAVGGLAVGVYAVGGGAIAWKAAVGGGALAHEIAVGGGAYAAHANDAVARNYVENSAFFSGAHTFMTHYAKHLQWLWVLALVPLAFAWRNRHTPAKPAGKG
jgi:RNA polymerase sigma factor (sigma-70 family)